MNKPAFFHHQGFTLAELLVAIVVIGILVAIAVPSFQSFLDKSRLVGAADNLLADMRYAQSESLKQNQDITVTFTTGANWSYTFNPPLGITSNTSSASYKGTTLTTNTATLTFRAKRSTISQAPSTGDLTALTLTSAKASILGLQLDANSHLTLCTGSAMGGYPTCP